MRRSHVIVGFTPAGVGISTANKGREYSPRPRPCQCPKPPIFHPRRRPANAKHESSFDTDFRNSRGFQTSNRQLLSTRTPQSPLRIPQPPIRYQNSPCPARSDAARRFLSCPCGHTTNEPPQLAGIGQDHGSKGSPWISFALDVATFCIYTIGMTFVWDEKKNRENIRKHGIAFRDVVDLFNHPMLIRMDTRRDYGEDRWIGVGLLRRTVAVVVYVEWEDEETIRIISARKATAYETNAYFKGIPH